MKMKNCDYIMFIGHGSEEGSDRTRFVTPWFSEGSRLVFEEGPCAAMCLPWSVDLK